MDEDELQRLLAFAERIVEAGIDPDLVRVQSVRAETDELMILDTSPGPPTASIWDSLVAQSKVFSEPELILCVSDALAADDVLETEPNELDTIAEPPCTMQIASQSELMFGSGSSGLRTERIQSFAPSYSENDVDEASSPVRELPPMVLFRESQPNPAGNARTGKQYDPAPDTPILAAYVIKHGGQGDTPAGSACDEYLDSAAQHDQFGASPSITLLQACRSRSTIFLRGAEVPSGRFTTEASLQTRDVVYYWVTHTHRVGDNLALAFALQLSRELSVPLVALAVIEDEEVHANTLGPGSSSAGNGVADGAPQWTPYQRDVLSSLRRRSTIRHAVLRNLQKDLAAIGVPLVCASYSALFAGNDASSSVMTSALVPRAVAEHPVVAMWRKICRTGSSSRYHEDDSPYREDSMAAVVVTDACLHPLTRFLCERVSADIGSSAVVAIDSNSLAPDSAEWINSHVDRMGSNASPTVEPCWALLGRAMQASVSPCSASEAAAQLLESVYYCRNNMRLVELAAVVETTATETHAQRKRQRAQEELASESTHTDKDFLASWSVAAATDTLLRACGEWDETKPRENFSSVPGGGALNKDITHIRTATAEPANGLGYMDSAEISSAERRALFSHVVDYIGYGLISPPVLHRALRSPLCVSTAEQASFRRELTDFVSSRMPAQRELARRVTVTAATSTTTDADQFSVSWLDLISAETVAQMRQLDAQQPRGTLVQVQQQLELLRGGATDCAVFNSIHRALTESGAFPVDRHLRYWIVYQARQLRSIEAAVRVAYTALAAHGNVSLDQCALRVLTFVEAVARVVRELGCAVEGGRGRNENGLSCMSLYLSQLL